MTVAIGARIYAADVNNIIALLPVTYSKAASTDRFSTTTLADDPELAGIALDVGTYTIELIGFFTLATITTQGLKTQWGFTGTWNTPIRACIGPGGSNVDARTDVTKVQLSGFTTAQTLAYEVAAGSGYAQIREIAPLVSVTVAGNLSLQWAQFNSSANITSLKAGTSFIVRKIS